MIWLFIALAVVGGLGISAVSKSHLGESSQWWFVPLFLCPVLVAYAGVYGAVYETLRIYF